MAHLTRCSSCPSRAHLSFSQTPFVECLIALNERLPKRETCRFTRRPSQLVCDTSRHHTIRAAYFSSLGAGSSMFNTISCIVFLQSFGPGKARSTKDDDHATACLHHIIGNVHFADHHHHLHRTSPCRPGRHAVLTRDQNTKVCRTACIRTSQRVPSARRLSSSTLHSLWQHRIMRSTTCSIMAIHLPGVLGRTARSWASRALRASHPEHGRSLPAIRGRPAGRL